MTVTGDGADDEGTHVDREPPSFPTVGESRPGSTQPAATTAPLFSSSAPNAGVETSPIVSTPLDQPHGSRGGRLRWLAAGMATLLVFVVIGGVLFLSAPRGGTASAVAHYAPADTAAYVEVRLDLPGDQLANLAAFMSHFPGFADRAAFQQKLDETLNSLLTSRTNGKLDWNNDVKPWFGGQVAAFGDFSAPTSVPMPACPAASETALCTQIGSTAAGPGHNGVGVFTVTDKAKLQSVIDAHAGGAQMTSQDYLGNQIQTIAQPAGTSTAFSYVVTDDALLVSADVDELKQALDVKAGQKSSLADDSFFLQQLGALHSDRLATFYYDASKQTMPAAMPTGSLLPAQCSQSMQAAMNVKSVGEARAEGDHLAFNIRTQLPSGDGAPPAPANRETTLAQQMPGDTVAYAETHSLGDTLGWGIKNMLGCMGAVQSGTGPLASGFGGTGDPSQLLQTLLGAKPEDFFDFVDDAALGVTYTNDKLGAGIVASVNDQATATARVNKLTALLALTAMGGSSAGTGIRSEQIDHNGTKVTVIHLPQGSGLSTDPSQTLEIAVANNYLYLGIGDFVTSALDRSAADSLASNPTYQKAISGGPAQNAGVFYIDTAAAIDAYAELLPATSVDNFDTNVKPFLEPIKSLSFVSHLDGGMLISNGFLFVE